MFFILTNDGYSKNKDRFFNKMSPDDGAWWLHCESNTMRWESYLFIMLFSFRVNTYNEENPKFMYIDDAATQHQVNEVFLKTFFELLNGHYISIAKCCTMYLQIADGVNCNRLFKHKTRHLARQKRREKIKEAMINITNNTKTRKVIGSFSKKDVNDIISKTAKEMNTSGALESTAIQVRRKCFIDEYDDDCRKISEEYETKYKDEKFHELYSKDDEKKNEYYTRNKIRFGHLRLDDKLLYYKNPLSAYICDCKWTYSQKKNQKRIDLHNIWCPIKSHYGVVPAYPPKFEKNGKISVDTIKAEFNGYQERMKNNKCLFNLIGRDIHFDNAAKIQNHPNKDFLKSVKVMQNAAIIREATIEEDLGKGWIYIKVGREEQGWPSKDVVNKHTVIQWGMAVLLKSLTWKKQKNIWIVDESEYDINWKYHQ